MPLVASSSRLEVILRTTSKEALEGALGLGGVASAAERDRGDFRAASCCRQLATSRRRLDDAAHDGLQYIRGIASVFFHIVFFQPFSAVAAAADGGLTMPPMPVCSTCMELWSVPNSFRMQDVSASNMPAMEQAQSICSGHKSACVTSLANDLRISLGGVEKAVGDRLAGWAPKLSREHVRASSVVFPGANLVEIGEQLLGGQLAQGLGAAAAGFRGCRRAVFELSSAIYLGGAGEQLWVATPPQGAVEQRHHGIYYISIITTIEAL